MSSGPPESRSRPAKTPLRVAFMGTPPLAAHILKRLIDAPDALLRLVGVITQPDQPRDRGLRREPSAVATVAERAGLPLLKPAKIRTPEFLAQLAAMEPDLILVAAYGRMLPNTVLEAARLAPINVHASLLPRHRGAAPVEGAILAGDRETGVTIMRITERLDAGPILLIRAIPIATDDTQATLKMKLADLGAAALLDAIDKLARGEITESPQDETLATYTRPVEKKDAIVDWRADAAQIERTVRAFDPWPIARTTLRGEPLLIHRATIADRDAGGAEPGTIIDLNPAPVVECGRGQLVLLEVQASGRKRMAGADFIRGRRIAIGERLGT
ncbi:MAG TPA: methionyl-tRNA formyltransferase [Candidatus Binataceae bacterium]|nr:methionyl-tRNA formyltransferase [Candidatus Binataceae bacterium]